MGLNMTAQLQYTSSRLLCLSYWPRCAAILLFSTTLSFGSANAASGADERSARVMTWNVDEGTDFKEVTAARSLPDFLAAVTTTFESIQATKPQERAAAIAREIANRRPLVVGLQEASILRTGSVFPATTVRSDLLQLILSELAKLGEHYSAVAIVPGLDAEAPSTLGFDVRLTTQDAILARTDLPPDEFKLSNIQVQHFATNVTISSAIGPITIPRGWASVDIDVRGRMFRFVTTHLDVTPPVQTAQAEELVQSAGNTRLPIVIAGDFNATANDPTDPSFASYESVLDGGFMDAWIEEHPRKPGFTCCQAPDLRNVKSSLNQRIDLIFFRGDFDVEDVQLVGNERGDRTPSGLWPSDHAGVAATLAIPEATDDVAERRP
jgi:endonuclease/exonuclease/phosphatase family metal-dependent hydrolase